MKEICMHMDAEISKVVEHAFRNPFSCY